MQLQNRLFFWGLPSGIQRMRLTDCLPIGQMYQLQWVVGCLCPLEEATENGSAWYWNAKSRQQQKLL